MLGFTYDFTYDKEANDFITTFINNGAKTQIEIIKELIDYEIEYDEATDWLDTLFPENFPNDITLKMHIIDSLYEAVSDDGKNPLSPIMTYIMYQIIRVGIEEFEADINEIKNEPDQSNDDILQERIDSKTEEHVDEYEIDRDHTVNIPFSDTITDKLCKAFTETYDDLGLGDYSEETAEEMVNSLWHFSDAWNYICFKDFSFLSLDDMSEEQIKALCNIG